MNHTEICNKTEEELADFLINILQGVNEENKQEKNLEVLFRAKAVLDSYFN